ncbi:MAG: hypothetical protein CMM94_05185 [Rickettsiales bacterium]|nr:hypothetical protein [Rickettsiales bacterium]|tara:strand:- start:93 stop:308 length:216 start_codon:yes stop_codon:yes gene_type:complete
MTTEEKEVYNHVKHMAEEQVIFLKNRYKMQPHEIISMYTGNARADATYDDAIESIAMFNMFTANKNGFVAS